MEKNGVIVIGGHVQGLGIIRIFGKTGIPVILLDDTKVNIAKHSRFCKAFHKYPKGQLLEFLLELMKNKEYEKWVLIPTNDLHVKLLSKNKDKLETFYNVSSDNWEVVEKCYNKRITYKQAVESGLAIPNTWTPDTEEELNALNIKFPCILKPAVMHTFYSKFKKKVFVCNNNQELISNYRKALTVIPPKEIIIQEIIIGGNENQFSACFMFNRKRPLVGLVAQRKRQHPLDFGNATTYAETIENPELYNSAVKLLEKIGYKGLCEVEFKKDDRDGIIKFLEINARTWKWHSIAEKSGSPFLMSMYNNVNELDPIIKTTWNKASFRHLITDVPTVLKMKSKGLKTPSKKTNIKYAVWDKSDLSPAFYELLYLPYLIFSR